MASCSPAAGAICHLGSRAIDRTQTVSTFRPVIFRRYISGHWIPLRASHPCAYFHLAGEKNGIIESRDCRRRHWRSRGEPVADRAADWIVCLRAYPLMRLFLLIVCWIPAVAHSQLVGTPP